MEWGIGGGLPLDDADVEITAMEFGFNNDIAAGVTFANITFTNLDDGEEHEQSFSLGTGWEAGKKGLELVSENGKPRKLSNQSNYGILTMSAVECLGGIENMADLGPGFRFVETWLGTQWHTGMKTLVRKNRETGVEKETSVVIFEKYLGRAGADAGGEAKPAGKAGKAKITAAEALGIQDSDLWKSLIELAQASDDHDAFMDAALELEGVEGVKEIERLVMSTKAGSVWAEAKS